MYEDGILEDLEVAQVMLPYGKVQQEVNRVQVQAPVLQQVETRL